jgi:hypothetical protein
MKSMFLIIMTAFLASGILASSAPTASPPSTESVAGGLSGTLYGEVDTPIQRRSPAGGSTSRAARERGTTTRARRGRFRVQRSVDLQEQGHDYDGDAESLADSLGHFDIDGEDHHSQQDHSQFGTDQIKHNDVFIHGGASFDNVDLRHPISIGNNVINYVSHGHYEAGASSRGGQPPSQTTDAGRNINIREGLNFGSNNSNFSHNSNRQSNQRSQLSRVSNNQDNTFSFDESNPTTSNFPFVQAEQQHSQYPSQASPARTEYRSPRRNSSSEHESVDAHSDHSANGTNDSYYDDFSIPDSYAQSFETISGPLSMASSLNHSNDGGDSSEDIPSYSESDHNSSDYSTGKTTSFRGKTSMKTTSSHGPMTAGRNNNIRAPINLGIFNNTEHISSGQNRGKATTSRVHEHKDTT